jgi:hypothetical protein
MKLMNTLLLSRQQRGTESVYSGSDESELSIMKATQQKGYFIGIVGKWRCGVGKTNSEAV